MDTRIYKITIALENGDVHVMTLADPEVVSPFDLGGFLSIVVGKQVRFAVRLSSIILFKQEEVNNG